MPYISPFPELNHPFALLRIRALTAPLYAYNPAFHSDDQIVDSFVVRQADLERLQAVLAPDAEPEPLLVVGPAGSGKSALMRRLAAQVRRDPPLQARWFPLLFPEENYTPLSAGQFWLEALAQLARHSGDRRRGRIARALQAEDDDQRLGQAALDQVLGFAEETSRRILLIVEQVPGLLSQFLGRNESRDLLATLQQQPHLLLWGTTRPAARAKLEPSWARYFSSHELGRLDADEGDRLWTAVQGVALPAVYRRPIHILTDGQPRWVRLMAAGAGEKDGLSVWLQGLVDGCTAQYKGQLDNLAPAERRVFIALLEHWDQATAQEVSSGARMNVSQTSALLHRLVERGQVEVAGTSGRKKWYQAADPMLELYYQLRRGGLEGRLDGLLQFAEAFYAGGDLLAALLAETAEDEAPDLGRVPAIDRVAGPQAQFALLEAVLAAAFDPLRRGPGRPTGQEPDTAWAWMRLGYSREVEKQWPAAAKAYLMAAQSEPGSALAFSLLARLLDGLGSHEDAAAFYQQVATLRPENRWALSMLARLQHHFLQQLDPAERSYRQVLRLDPGCQWARTQLATMQAAEGGDAALPQQPLLESLVAMRERQGIGCQSDLVAFWRTADLGYGADALVQAGRDGLRRQPDRWDARYLLASVLAAGGDWAASLEQVPPLLAGRGDGGKLALLVDWLLSAVAAGQGEAVDGLLQALEPVGALEALQEGLDGLRGRDSRRARAMRAVGRDVADEVRRRQQD